MCSLLRNGQSCRGTRNHNRCLEPAAKALISSMRRVGARYTTVGGALPQYRRVKYDARRTTGSLKAYTGPRDIFTTVPRSSVYSERTPGDHRGAAGRDQGMRSASSASSWSSTSRSMRRRRAARRRKKAMMGAHRATLLIGDSGWGTIPPLRMATHSIGRSLRSRRCCIPICCIG